MTIFLDLDGVLIPAKGWKRPELLKDGFPAFSQLAVKSLNTIINNQVCVMLTTSHKSNFTIAEWKLIFENRGVQVSNLKMLPENISRQSRKDEILSFFHNNIVDEDYVIIDDDNTLNDLPKSIKNKFIQTSPLIGLTMENADAIRTILFPTNRATLHRL